MKNLSGMRKSFRVFHLKKSASPHKYKKKSPEPLLLLDSGEAQREGFEPEHKLPYSAQLLHLPASVSHFVSHCSAFHVLSIS